jgi:hypothetical protein
LAARALIDEIVEMLCQKFGYRRARPKTSENHADQQPFDASLMAWQPLADYEIPRSLYLLVHQLMPNSSGHDRRRVIGLLRPLVRKHEGRNQELYNKATCLRLEFISRGIITSAAAELLLLEAARLNGYTKKDGVAAAAATIRSGLGLQIINEASRLDEEEKAE